MLYCKWVSRECSGVVPALNWGREMSSDHPSAAPERTSARNIRCIKLSLSNSPAPTHLLAGAEPRRNGLWLTPSPGSSRKGDGGYTYRPLRQRLWRCSAAPGRSARCSMLPRIVLLSVVSSIVHRSGGTAGDLSRLITHAAVAAAAAAAGVATVLAP
jgi:hypothetical protein